MDEQREAIVASLLSDVLIRCLVTIERISKVVHIGQKFRHSGSSSRAAQSGKNKAGMQPEGENFSNILGAFSNAFPHKRPCDKRDWAPPQGLTCIFNGGNHRDKMINHIDRTINHRQPSTIILISVYITVVR